MFAKNNCCGMNQMPNMDLNCCEKGCKMGPVCERPIEKCVHRCIVHEVPHVCPIRTRVINHHIIRHTYCPNYACCEENQVCHINEGSCCNF